MSLVISYFISDDIFDAKSATESEGRSMAGGGGRTIPGSGQRIPVYVRRAGRNSPKSVYRYFRMDVKVEQNIGENTRGAREKTMPALNFQRHHIAWKITQYVQCLPGLVSIIYVAE